MKNKSCGMTLVELSIAIILLSLLVLSYHGIDYFSRAHTIDANRRARLQNELAFVLEHMAKNVQRGIGLTPAVFVGGSGFTVNVDNNTPATPGNTADDSIVSYSLTGNTLTCTVNAVTETVATHIISGVVNGVVTDPPTGGFNISITDNGAVIEVGLVARWHPAQAKGPENPEVVLKSKLYARCAPAN